MVRIEETQKRIIDRMNKYGVSSLNLVNKEGLGIVLDSCSDHPDTLWDNIEVKTIYSSLNADTNIGSINLVEEVLDEDDWYTLEDIVNDLVPTREKKKIEVHYSFYLSDSIEVEAADEEEAKEKVRGMILNAEIGNLNEMDIGEQKIWVD